MDDVSLLIINLLPPALFVVAYLFWRTLRKRHPSPILFDLLMYFVALKIVLVMWLPAFLRVFSGWRFERQINATSQEVALVYGLEFISYGIWFAAVGLTSLVCAETYKRKAAYSAAASTPIGGGKINGSSFKVNDSGVFFLICLALYLLLFPYTVEMALKPVEGFAYFLKPAVVIAGPVVGMYLFALGRARVGTLCFTLGIVVTLVSLLYGLATGVRGQVIGPALWFVFLYYLTRNKQSLHIAVVAFATVLIVHATMVQQRVNDGTAVDTTPLQKIRGFVAEALGGDVSDTDFVTSLEFRLGEASRLSVAFLRLYDRGEAAGWQPIKSALYAPLPRRFFPDKPEPGSADGTLEGTGMHMIQGVMRGEPWNMSDFFSGVHAYWEFGLLGLVFCSFVSGAFIGFWTHFCGRLGSAALPFMMITMQPWWLEPKLWLSQLILHSIHVLLPLTAIWLVSTVAMRSLGSLRKVIAFTAKEQTIGAKLH